VAAAICGVVAALAHPGFIVFGRFISIWGMALRKLGVADQALE